MVADAIFDPSNSGSPSASRSIVSEDRIQNGKKENDMRRISVLRGLDGIEMAKRRSTLHFKGLVILEKDPSSKSKGESKKDVSKAKKQKEMKSPSSTKLRETKKKKENPLLSQTQLAVLKKSEENLEKTHGDSISSDQSAAMKIPLQDLDSQTTKGKDNEPLFNEKPSTNSPSLQMISFGNQESKEVPGSNKQRRGTVSIGKQETSQESRGSNQGKRESVLLASQKLKKVFQLKDSTSKNKEDRNHLQFFSENPSSKRRGSSFEKGAQRLKEEYSKEQSVFLTGMDAFGEKNKQDEVLSGLNSRQSPKAERSPMSIRDKSQMKTGTIVKGRKPRKESILMVVKENFSEEKTLKAFTKAVEFMSILGAFRSKFELKVKGNQLRELILTSIENLVDNEEFEEYLLD